MQGRTCSRTKLFKEETVQGTICIMSVPYLYHICTIPAAQTFTLEVMLNALAGGRPETSAELSRHLCVAAAFVCRRPLCVSPPPLCLAAAFVCRRRLCFPPPPLCERVPPRHLERLPKGIAFGGTLATYYSYTLCFPQGPLPLILCAPCQTFLQRPLGVNSKQV